MIVNQASVSCPGCGSYVGPGEGRECAVCVEVGVREYLGAIRSGIHMPTQPCGAWDAIEELRKASRGRWDGVDVAEYRRRIWGDEAPPDILALDRED